MSHSTNALFPNFNVIVIVWWSQYARDDKEGKIAGSDARNLYVLLGIHLMLDSSWIARECHAGNLGYNTGLLAYSTFLSCCFNE